MSTLSLALSRPTASRRTAFAKIVRNEARLAWRRPVGLIAGVAIPVLLVSRLRQHSRLPAADARPRELHDF